MTKGTSAHKATKEPASQKEFSRRKFLHGSGLGMAAFLGASFLPNNVSFADSPLRGRWKIGRGISDMTGAIAGQGMMGYSEPEQVAEGLRQRYFARAFVIVDETSQTRLLYINADLACLFESIHTEALKRLQERFGDVYGPENVMITATHNHNSCGGTAHDFAYSLASSGFRANSFEAEVSGIVEAAEHAHADVAPGEIHIGRTELHDASANRSRVAFELNPQEDRDYFPNAIDPRIIALRFTRNGADIGVLTWYATHGTSLTDKNQYISPDNKGLASYRWEHDDMGEVYLNGDTNFVAAFSQTNTGDMTPNVFLRTDDPGGPTDNNVENNSIIADKQLDACKRAFSQADSLTGSGIKYVFKNVDFAHQNVDARFTHTGQPGITTPTIMGLTGAAGSTEDGAHPPAQFLREGVTDPLAPMWGLTDIPPIPQNYLAAQAPKVNLLPLGFLPPTPWNPQILPIQIVQLGDLVIVGGPVEFTIVSGLRIRRLVAEILGVDLENVICQGYTNSYCQYVTTPEEYESQQYEGGETQFGINTLGAFLQNYEELAISLRDGHLGNLGGPEPLDQSEFQPDALPAVPPDLPIEGFAFGDMVTNPQESYVKNTRVEVEFCGAHPNNMIRRNNTYLEIQSLRGGQWVRIADDNYYNTTLHWERPEGQDQSSIIRILWDIPGHTQSGKHRIVYHGEWKDNEGTVTSFDGTSPEFAVI